MKGILLGSKFLVKEEKIQIKVFSNNTAVITYTNKIGNAHSVLCHPFTKLI